MILKDKLSVLIQSPDIIISSVRKAVVQVLHCPLRILNREQSEPFNRFRFYASRRTKKIIQSFLIQPKQYFSRDSKISFVAPFFF